MGVAIFQGVALVGCAAAFVVLIRRSVRAGAVEPALFMTIAFVSTGWMEPIYDWALYAQFHPDFWRAPDWGVLGLTHGGLPAIAGPAYGVYFLVGGLSAVALAKRVGPRCGLRPGTALLLCGYATGFVWDGVIEFVGTQSHLWAFTRVARGFVPFGGTAEQFPLGMPLGMGLMVAISALLLGNVGGSFPPGRWSERLFGSRHGTASTLLTAVVVCHIATALVLVPYVVTKVAHLGTVAVEEPVYDIPNQGF